MPPTSVLRSRQPLVLTLHPGGWPPLAAPSWLEPKPPADPLLLPGNPPSLVPDCPYCKSISRPSTALTRPTANSKSGRNRDRAYHSLSLLRVRLPPEEFLPIAETWSNSPAPTRSKAALGANRHVNPRFASVPR